MNKVHKIVMLPTEDIHGLLKGNGLVRYVPNLRIEPTNGYMSQHLYIISDDEIKEGDSVITLQDKSLVKVLATTDPKLTKVDEVSGDNVWTSPIPQIPQSIIEYYAKHQLDEVELKYEGYTLPALSHIEETNHLIRLKLNNNEVVWAEPEFYSQKYGKFKGVFRYNEDESVEVVEINSLDKVKTLYTREEMLQEKESIIRHFACNMTDLPGGEVEQWIKENL